MITYFLGHLHPILLHLPIGLFSLAMIAFYFHPDKSFRLSRQLNFMLMITGISSIISAITGWLLGHSGDYQEAAVRLHQWTAIAFTVMSAILSGIHWYSLRKNQLHRAFQPLLGITFLLMMYTGHGGGTLTHGEGFLLMDEPFDETISNADAGKNKDEPNNEVIKNKKDTSGTLPSIALADSLNVKKLQQSGFMVKPVSAGSGWLEVSTVSMTGLEKKQLQMLESISKNIFSLNLSGHALIDDDVHVLVKLENLKKLDVRNTGLSDHFLENIVGLSQLEYINLVGTKVSDDGLKYLSQLKGLKKVYCWNSEITIQAITALNQKRPDVFMMTE